MPPHRSAVSSDARWVATCHCLRFGSMVPMIALRKADIGQVKESNLVGFDAEIGHLSIVS